MMTGGIPILGNFHIPVSFYCLTYFIHILIYYAFIIFPLVAISYPLVMKNIAMEHGPFIAHYIPWSPMSF